MRIVIFYSLRGFLILFLSCVSFLTEAGQIHQAVQKGDKNLLSVVLEESLLDSRDRHGNTVLHIAVQRQDVEMVQLLLKRGLNVNARNRAGETALHIACRLRNEEIAHFLLKKDMNLNLGDKNGDTVLHVASRRDLPSVILELLNKGANINVQNNGGNTPLHNVSSLNNFKLIRLFIKRGANVNIKNKKQNTALDFVMRASYEYASLVKNYEEYEIVRGKAVNALKTALSNRCRASLYY